MIVSDTFGRAWRRGVTDVAIGCAGVAAVVDLQGTTDASGRELSPTEICVADEMASAAELVMGKDRGVPVAVVRGVPTEWLRPASVARRDHPAPGRGPLPLSRSGAAAARDELEHGARAVGQLGPRPPPELDRRPLDVEARAAAARRAAAAPGPTSHVSSPPTAATMASSETR